MSWNSSQPSPVVSNLATMAREVGGWLSGPPTPSDHVAGVRLGLPAEGPGSVASTGARIGAFIIDAIVANLLAGIPYLFGVRYTPNSRTFIVLGAFLLIELLLDASYGQTVGKRILGIRVIRVDGSGLASFPWLILRTVLLGALVPAVVWDRDRRGLHDKAAGTVVVVDPNKALEGRSSSSPVKTGTS
ncbi:MAG: domain containing protein, partial [Mycobacterium sp.]|nr:domain containing protein [Mycobacterium sp.]